MIFSEYESNSIIDNSQQGAIFALDNRTRKIAVALITVVLIWFYYTYNLNSGAGSANPVDDYTNFRFMWDVT